MFFRRPQARSCCKQEARHSAVGGRTGDRSPRSDSAVPKPTKPPQLPTVDAVRRDGNAAGALAQIGTVMRSFDARHRQSYNQSVLLLYALAELLRDNEDARLDFCRDKAWAGVKRNRPRHDQPDRMLSCALRLANGLGDNAGSKRASKQFRALGPLFEQGLPLTEIDRRLRDNGGIDGLAKAHTKPRPARSTTGTGLSLVLSPGPRANFLGKQRPGQSLSLHLRVTQMKTGIVHADVTHIAHLPKFLIK